MYPILFQFGSLPIYAYGFFIVVCFATAALLAILRIGDLLSTSQAIGILLAIFSVFMLFYIRKRYRRQKDGGS